MRHAKSDWSGNLPDFERSLNKRGLKDAKKMGAWLKKKKFVPELVVSSPAERAMQTTRIVCKQLGINSDEIILDKRIYEADLDDLLQVILEHGKKVNSLMLTGHNPGLDYLVNYLSGDQPHYTENGKLMTTAAIVVFNFEYEFSGKKGSGNMVIMARPKEI